MCIRDRRFIAWKIGFQPLRSHQSHQVSSSKAASNTAPFLHPHSKSSPIDVEMLSQSRLVDDVLQREQRHRTQMCIRDRRFIAWKIGFQPLRSHQSHQVSSSKAASNTAPFLHPHSKSSPIDVEMLSQSRLVDDVLQREQRHRTQMCIRDRRFIAWKIGFQPLRSHQSHQVSSSKAASNTAPFLHPHSKSSPIDVEMLSQSRLVDDVLQREQRHRTQMCIRDRQESLFSRMTSHFHGESKFHPLCG
ncbi:hypothetical protein DEO72_LG8g2305 [Vigna unguiculata]|uniref:Uncharacterized protein n=1 Tax=Vigna unguiculata TaxID=3917 RepID=A0A4D6MRY7_VIGUN|nr:hypothetical protein DEO72_LG8g2305 [Vigna unguiculata]